MGSHPAGGRRLARLLLLLAAVSAPTATAANDIPVLVPGPSVTIFFACTLTLPEGRGPFPGVVLVTGSGPQVRTGLEPNRPGLKPFDLLAEGFAAQGVASLRCDDRGVGASTGTFETARHADLMRDALKQAQYLRRRPEVDAHAVGLLGHSDGASVAARAAAVDRSIAFVIGLAPPAVPGLELMQQQITALTSSGADAAAVGEAADEFEAVRLAVAGEWAQLRRYLEAAYVEQLRNMHGGAALSEVRLHQLARDAAREAVARTYRDPWYLEFLRHDPREDWKRVHVPVLALYGELDAVVPPAGNAEPLARLLLAGGQPQRDGR